jgi:NAD(P)-dependent dehydrogenase (short-subunit alcohol dehydrogenase family)
MSLSGKVAIVSGAADGLGQAFAIRLAEEGCKVLGFDVNKEVLDVPGITGMVADV